MEKYYQKLLAPETYIETRSSRLEDKDIGSNQDNVVIPEKWRGQIEKVSHSSSVVKSLYYYKPIPSTRNPTL